MKRALKILAAVIILSIFVYTIYFLYQKSQAKPVEFETTQAFKTEIIKSTVATGSVIPRKEIMIKPQVSGIVEELYVEAGDMIKKGDLLAKIKIIPDMVSLNNAQSRLNRARISFDDSKRQYERQKDLLEQGVVALAEFEPYDLAYKNAIEEVEAAENNLELIKEGQTKKGGQATNTIVRSTAEGMVLDVPVEVGFSVIESNTFNDGTTIASVADMGDMIFEGKIDETEVGKIKEGMPLILTVGAIDDASFTAVLEHISPKGVEENGAIQFEIKANVELQKDQFIRAGYSANAKVVLDRTDSVMAIPESILQFEGDSSYVEVETAPQQFEKRFIKTGLSDGINVEVKSGLSMEDKIKKPSGSLK
ncbi:MAG: efflux RND transporter periplasmic adaptor subunit [Bacteroidales bacterium]|jgi:HlyD family secretion protein|nr:efflux RND transporter periplasmic adaptor subunit [Bacteroidales bacterium]